MRPDLLQALWRLDGCTAATPMPSAFALVDHGGAAGLLGVLQSEVSLPWRSLFEGSKEEGALEVAPLLIGLGPVGAQPSASSLRLARWLHTHCAGSHAVLGLRSALTFDTLAASLQRRLDAVLAGGLPAMLRYFDTRIFEPLAGALTPQQAADFLGIAQRWVWFDRAGQVRELPCEPQARDEWPARFALTQAQEDALVEAAEPDAVLAHMRAAGPDLCRTQPSLQLHALVRRALPVAKHFGITDARQQALFCLAEIETGPDFHESPAWKQVLDEARGSGASFSQLLQQVPKQ